MVRPQPERPKIVVEPLRVRPEPTRSGGSTVVSLGAWAVVAAILIGLAAVVALNYEAVRAALDIAVSQNSSGATRSEVDDTVTATLLGSAAAAAVLILVAGVGLTLAASRRGVSGVILMAAGLATIGAFVLFWSFMSDAADIAAGALRWGPLAGAAVAAIATVAAAGAVLTRR